MNSKCIRVYICTPWFIYVYSDIKTVHTLNCWRLFSGDFSVILLASSLGHLRIQTNVSIR